jgi:hypothetical protein
MQFKRDARESAKLPVVLPWLALRFLGPVAALVALVALA